MPRFYLPPSEWLASQPQLNDADTYHCARVLRQNVGDVITVFDGAGSQAAATITGFHKNNGYHAILTLGTPVKTSSPPCAITLVQAVPKAKNMDLIIQKGVELGVSRIIPLLSERTVLRCPSEKDAVQKQERWQQIAIEACKQCGQNWLPSVEKPSSVKNFLATTAPQQLLLIASLETERRSLKEVLAVSPLPTEVTIMIGPEGDFTPDEYAAAKNAGFQPLDLGPIILRTETAALYCLSVLGHELR